MTKFIASIKGALCDADIGIEELPIEFKDAYDAWKRKDATSLELLTPYLSCSFVSMNLLGNINDLFISCDDIAAKEVTIIGLEFPRPGLPIVKARALFQINTVEDFSMDKLKLWEDRNEQLDSAITFEWVGVNSEEDLCLTTHEGLSFRLAD